MKKQTIKLTVHNRPFKSKKNHKNHYSKDIECNCDMDFILSDILCLALKDPSIQLRQPV